jgi:hypothetical protein
MRATFPAHFILLGNEVLLPNLITKQSSSFKYNKIWIWSP